MNFEQKINENYISSKSGDFAQQELIKNYRMLKKKKYLKRLELLVVDF